MTDRSTTKHTDNEPEGAEGVVIRSTGSWCDVRTSSETLPCRVRGRFRLGENEATNPVAVGDRVTIQRNPDQSGVITHIHERSNQLGRRAAGRRGDFEHVIVANVDRIWIVQSIRLPKPNPGFIDRVLVEAEANEIPAGLILNKIDLLRERDAGAFEVLYDLYERLGYPVLVTSAETGEGTGALCKQLTGRTSVLTGPSGTGKSSLLNAIEPGWALDTSNVSQKTRKGRHTTAHALLLPLSGGGCVIDTPGLREFGILRIEPWELSHRFVEFKSHLGQCRFPTCTHDHEPACAVREAVKRGAIPKRRYHSYLNILASIQLGERDVGR